MTTASLQARLARSLDSANRKQSHTAPRPAARPSPRPAPVPTPGTKCSKLSVSLFASDLARIDAITAYLAARGARISTSQAVKLALRTAPLSSDLTAALAAIKSEDGRTR